MSFNLNPVFSFRMNQNIVGQIKFGKYDGTHVCLTAATSTDKVIIHSPHKKIGSVNTRISWSETNYDVAVLNFNQEITAIETGCVLSKSDNIIKDILVIGSPTHVLAYNVDDNTDLFYKSVTEGVSHILIGMFGTHLMPLVLLGGNDSVRGYDHKGNEIFWIVTNGSVKSLTLIDINKDGKNELIVGTHSGNIIIYKNETILLEITENAAIQSICQIEKTSLLSYTLNDGTLGVYDDNVRLWRVKSKNKATSLASFDLLGQGRHQLIVGWENGKVDIRDYSTGDVLFKLNFQQTIISLGQADYRGIGSNDLILCTGNGEVRGYEKSKINLFSMKSAEQEELTSLLARKKNLLAEISHYESNVKVNKERSLEDATTAPIPINDMAVIPANTRLQIAIYTNIEDMNNANIEIKIATNNSTVIRAVLVFSEGIFASETLIAYPIQHGVPRVVIPIRMPKDICYDVNIKALIGTEHTQQYHVFELTRQLPRFSMYALLENYLYSSKPPPNFLISQNFVLFKITERFQRICLWINQNFLLSTDIDESMDENLTEYPLYLISLYDKSNIQISYNTNTSEIIIYTDNIELAGNLIQSLAEFLNLENLQTKAYFPKIEEEIDEMFRKIDGYQATYQNLSLNLFEKKNQQKNLIIRIEDAKLYHPESLVSLYSDMEKLTEDMCSSYTIRQKNFVEIQKSLDKINIMLKSAGKLRVGQFAVNMMDHLKEAVRMKNINAINKIISTGIK